MINLDDLMKTSERGWRRRGSPALRSECNELLATLN